MTANFLDREPVWRKLENRIGDRPRRLRNTPGTMLRRRVPEFENRNFGGGIGVGIVEAAVAVVLKESIGVPFGSDTEVVDSSATGNGMRYTVNVDSPFENMAEARAFIESGTGFTSILTDKLDVENTQVVKTRVLRDTYQIEVLVED